MIHTRLLAVGCAAACLPGLAAPVAAHAATSPAIRASVRGRPGGDGTVNFTLTNTNPLGGLPAPMLGPLVVDLPRGLRIATSGFPMCTYATLAAGPAGCPAGSRVGTGSAEIAADLAGAPFSERATMAVYVTGLDPLRLLFWTHGTSPVEETIIASAALSSARGSFGNALTVDVPAIPTVPGASNASIVSLSTTFSASRRVRVTTRVRTRVHGRRITRVTRRTKTIDAITLPRTCTSRTMPWAATVAYADGTQATARTTSACPAPVRHARIRRTRLRAGHHRSRRS